LLRHARGARVGARVRRSPLGLVARRRRDGPIRHPRVRDGTEGAPRRMTTATPREMLAEALGALGATLRHHRDLGFTALPLAGEYLLSPAGALRAQARALAGCRRCKLCGGSPT